MRTIRFASSHGLAPWQTVVAPALLCGVQVRRVSGGGYHWIWEVWAFPLMGAEFCVARYGPSRDEARDRDIAEGTAQSIRDVIDEEGNPFA